jgi:3'-phosphoadenosine 5'-phosphosulfate sulfotransferase (PAPS reductase)/FAD synthetase
MIKYPLATKPFLLPEGNVQISFSGGRTSAYMLHQILEANNGLPNRAKIVFTNTGREMNETLDFTQECSDRWNVHVTWLEYNEVDGKNTFKEVNHNSASRNGEPFDKLIDKYGRLPNALQRFCTGVLKIQTSGKYLKSLGWNKWNNALGIRADEPRRYKTNYRDGFYPYYPIYEANKTLVDVNNFWNRQPFKLNLPVVRGKTLKGNCDLCFLKSESQLAMIMKENPERAVWWLDTEKRFGKQFNRDRNLASLSDFVANQQDWVFDQQGYFCQADDGECTG